jgi:hypothetical protein
MQLEVSVTARVVQDLVVSSPQGSTCSTNMNCCIASSLLPPEQGGDGVAAVLMLTSMPMMSDTLATPSAHSSMGDKHLYTKEVGAQLSRSLTCRCHWPCFEPAGYFTSCTPEHGCHCPMHLGSTRVSQLLLRTGPVLSHSLGVYI